MKLAWLLFFVGVVPIAAAPVTYDMTFTGGFFSDRLNETVPFAPESGSFTYDATVGFSNFAVQYDGATFDFTSAANAGNAASVFDLLFSNDRWFSNETAQGPDGSAIDTQLSLAGLTAFAPHFPEFVSPGDPPRDGTFALSVAPEPVNAGIVMLGLCAILVSGKLRLRTSSRD